MRPRGLRVSRPVKRKVGQASKQKPQRMHLRVFSSTRSISHTAIFSEQPVVRCTAGTSGRSAIHNIVKPKGSEKRQAHRFSNSKRAMSARFTKPGTIGIAA